MLRLRYKMMTNDKEKTKMNKYLNALETISDILRSNDSDATKLKADW